MRTQEKIKTITHNKMMPSYIAYMKKAKNDEWYTPKYGIKPIIKYLPKNKIIWCPFDTETSNYVKLLKKSGFKVIFSHTKTNKDFFKYEPKEWDIIVSNPPFSIKNEVLERVYNFKKPFALLLPLSSLEGIFRTNLYSKYGLEVLKFDRRISFNHTKGISFATGYFCYKLLPEKLIHETLCIKEEN